VDPLAPARPPTERTAHRTVGEAMLRRPKVLPATTTVDDARDALADDHVHALLLLDDGVLVAVAERADLAGVAGDTPAAHVGRLAGRTVAPTADLTTTWAGMTAAGRRRIAVVDDRGRLVGLLCLKRSGRGFCSDADVAARAADTAISAVRTA
jgi:CBS domain-containing protein